MDAILGVAGVSSALASFSPPIATPPFKVATFPFADSTLNDLSYNFPPSEMVNICKSVVWRSSAGGWLAA